MLYTWELEKAGREPRVRVEGQLAFNNVSMILRAAMAGFGLACVLGDHVTAHIAHGSLVRVLDDWCPPLPATIFTTRAGASHRRPSHSWLMRFASGNNGRKKKGIWRPKASIPSPIG